MRVWCDLFSGDEMVSDSYKMYGDLEATDDSEVYDLNKHQIMRVLAKTITKKEGKIDIGGDEENDAEEEEGVSVINLVDAHNLQEVSLSKKDFMATVKPLLKRVVEHMKEKEKGEEAVKAFQAAATQVIKFVVGKFDEFQIYCGESYDTEASMCFSYYPDGATDPTFLFLTQCYKMKKL